MSEVFGDQALPVISNEKSRTVSLYNLVGFNPIGCFLLSSLVGLKGIYLMVHSSEDQVMMRGNLRAYCRMDDTGRVLMVFVQRSQNGIEFTTDEMGVMLMIRIASQQVRVGEGVRRSGALELLRRLHPHRALYREKETITRAVNNLSCQISFQIIDPIFMAHELLIQSLAYESLYVTAQGKFAPMVRIQQLECEGKENLPPWMSEVVTDMLCSMGPRQMSQLIIYREGILFLIQIGMKEQNVMDCNRFWELAQYLVTDVRQFYHFEEVELTLLEDSLAIEEKTRGELSTAMVDVNYLVQMGVNTMRRNWQLASMNKPQQLELLAGLKEGKVRLSQIVLRSEILSHFFLDRLQKVYMRWTTRRFKFGVGYLEKATPEAATVLECSLVSRKLRVPGRAFMVLVPRECHPLLRLYTNEDMILRMMLEINARLFWTFEEGERVIQAVDSVPLSVRVATELMFLSLCGK